MVSIDREPVSCGCCGAGQHHKCHNRKASEQRIERKVRKFGWCATHVFDPQHRSPVFTYTVGMSKIGGCELVIVGFGQDFAHEIFSRIFERMRSGASIQNCGPRDDILVGEHVWICPVSRQFVRRNMGAARKVLRNRPDVRQVVIADDDGRLPWHDGADPVYRAMQQLLEHWTGWAPCPFTP